MGSKAHAVSSSCACPSALNSHGLLRLARRKVVVRDVLRRDPFHAVVAPDRYGIARPFVKRESLTHGQAYGPEHAREIVFLGRSQYANRWLWSQPFPFVPGNLGFTEEAREKVGPDVTMVGIR